MEPSKFDELTKALATATSRRQALKAIAATTLGSILGLAGIGTAFAKCHDVGHNCEENSTCCSQNCCIAAGQREGVCCGTGQTCQNGTCTGCANPASDLCNAGPGSCGANGCECVQSVEGGSYCASQILCGSCTSNSDCVGQFGSGSICVFQHGCICATTPGGVCVSVSPLATCMFHCFTGETLIAMADGTSRPIEHIRVGDLVLGNAGQVNRVTEVHHPLLGQRPLYAFNESGYFVTSGHPFMTEEGWKAVDPSAVPPHLSELHVGRLTVGDRLLTLTAAAVPVGAGRSIGAEALDVRIESVALRSLIDRPTDPATQLYNLRLDGDHTYFANGLLVHNK